MSEQIIPYTRQQLVELKSRPPEHGYPSTENRLILPKRLLGKMAVEDAIIIPDGPWFVNDHPNRKGVDPARLDQIVTAENPARPEQTEHWQREGYLIDRRLGLPLHPRFPQLIQAFGMYAGPGFSYRYGPQKATNLGLRAVEGDTIYYLLTKVFSRNAWGLPGGYQDEGETLLAGAFRELKEETGVILSAETQQGLTIVSGFVPPSGLYRDTMHSWMEQYFHFVLTLAAMDRQAFGNLAPEDKSEIQALRWCTVEEIQNGTIPGYDGLTELPIMSSHQKQVLQNELNLAA